MRNFTVYKRLRRSHQKELQTVSVHVFVSFVTSSLVIIKCGIGLGENKQGSSEQMKPFMNDLWFNRALKFWHRIPHVIIYKHIFQVLIFFFLSYCTFSIFL